MEKEGKYSLIIKEKKDGSYSFKFQDPSWHREDCPLTNTKVGRGGFLLPRQFVNFPEDRIELCYDCRAYRFLEESE